MTSRRFEAHHARVEALHVEMELAHPHARFGRRSMRDDVEKAAAVSRRLVPLRDRLAELHAEEREIEAQIAECMRELAVATGSHAAVAFVGTDPATRILAVLHRQPDRIFSPA